MSDHSAELAQPGPPCIDCGCELVPQSVWGKASVEQRRELVAADKRMAQGRGMCRSCYHAAWRTGVMPKRSPLAQAPQEPRPCSRCGLMCTRGLCVDCVDVLDRDELALWTA